MRVRALHAIVGHSDRISSEKVSPSPSDSTKARDRARAKARAEIPSLRQNVGGYRISRPFSFT